MLFFNASNEKRTKYLLYCEQNGYTSKSSDVLSMDKTVFKSQRLVYCTGIIFLIVEVQVKRSKKIKSKYIQKYKTAEKKSNKN